jgi:exodeoxyribonuclease VII small subunit
VTTTDGHPSGTDGSSPVADGSSPVADGSSPVADGYGAALAELEALLEDLERADIDVDHLSKRVARGAELIRFCRERLDVVDRDVAAVVEGLLTTDGAGPATGDAASDEDR